MPRPFTLSLVVVLVTAPSIPAGFPTDFFTVHCAKVGYARAEGGRLTLGASSVNRVPDRQAAPDKWYVDGGRLKSSVGGGYLAYDASGKDPKVFLASKPGRGAEWDSVVHRRRESDYATVRAASGPFKGWYLNVKDGNLVLGTRASDAVRVERFYGHK
jgi:hypothetical protein